MEDPIVASRNARWGSYAVAFLITALIFATAFFASNYFGKLRVADIRATQDDISTDILSIETQFDLLQEHSCSDIAENTILPSALSSLGDQLSYLEAQGSGSDSEVLRLKRLYSLLEIKDYLLMKQIASKCNLKPVFILYFYSNTGNCADCEKQGTVLTALSQKYPQLRIYSFDYNLDVSALRTLIAIDNVENTMPALVIGSKTYYGFNGMTSIEKVLPQLSTLQKSATSTKQ
jgi:thiol-disulfide isomerase/thioredoxin